MDFSHSIAATSLYPPAPPGPALLSVLPPPAPSIAWLKQGYLLWLVGVEFCLTVGFMKTNEREVIA